MVAASSEILLAGWLSELKQHAVTNRKDEPHYYASNPEILITKSRPMNFTVGTGSQILSAVSTSCLAAKHEVIIVTCFWASSKSQEDVCNLLKLLSHKATSQNQRIRVRLCFSSMSVVQKLFQTASLEGRIYEASSWPGLGLPRAEELMGLDLVVKSVFVRPFSVMHPKFVVVDRQLAFLPSCNVSWEAWFEGCMEMRGEIAERLFDFWSEFWSCAKSRLLPWAQFTATSAVPETPSATEEHNDISRVEFSNYGSEVQTILLPSPHHLNPQFSLFSLSVPPPTPLNTFLLHIFQTAQSSIYIQTPNLTCRPVVAAIFSALQRGIDVQIITSRRLMLLEQIVTAATVTELEIWSLKRRYESLSKSYQDTTREDPEMAMKKPGRLRIGYYRSKEGSFTEEPVKSHLKLVIVDEEITVLGSGNMDRASWYTSQELGVAFFSSKLADQVKECVNNGMRGRIEEVSTVGP